MKMIKLMYTKVTLLVVMLLMFSACDDVLNVDPLDQPSDAAVWSDAAMTEAFVNDIYWELPHDFNEIMMATFTDEAAFTHAEIGVAQGIYDATNLYDTHWGWAHWNGPPGDYNLIWENIYGAIRKTNLFFKNFNPENFDDPELAEALTGEVHFLRAMKYFDLVRLWGGVPIIDEVFELDSDMQIPRNTFEEVVDYVIDEADAAADRLDWQPREGGRASKGAALALKNRMLTYAASDLYHNTDEWAGGYSNPELVGYTSSGPSQQELWTRARDVALQIMNEGPFELYDANPDPVRNFQDIWLQGGGNEAMMSFEVSEEHEAWIVMGQWHGPNGYNLWGGSTPQQALVDDFETLDGEEFDWDNPDHATDPWDNRDPRLEATVMVDGYDWRERPDPALDPQGKVQTYLTITCVGSDDCPDRRPGLDTRDGPIEDWNGTRTGYYLNKFIDPDVVHHQFQNEAPWHYFRYAEILLNYAEAQIELGNEGEARDAINQIRERVNMPEIDDSGDDLVERYRNERRVELAYEMHRYFDVRRWMIAPEVEDEDAHGIYLHAEYEYDSSAERNGMYDYEYVEPPDDIELPTDIEFAGGNPAIGFYPVWPRAWQDHTYILPIQRDEMNRNEALIQNPNY